MSVSIIGIGETPRVRHTAETYNTLIYMRDAALLAIRDAGLTPADIDGLAVASFSLEPDRAIDVTWRLGLSTRWLLQDTNGGVASINMLGHAIRGIETGAASNILILAGDATSSEGFVQRARNWNSATRDHLSPLGYSGPSALFAMLTLRQMKKYGLVETDYGHLVTAQRHWAAGNPLAAYRSPMSMEDYQNSPMVAPPLRRYDCVPVVAGASAMIVSATPRREASGAPVQVLSCLNSFNHDHQEGDGLQTGVRHLAAGLWNVASVSPSDMDVVSVYDDFPAMAFAQLADLGFIADDDIARFARERLATREFPVNTGGGMLSGGQPGNAGGLQGIVEVVRQLQHRGGERQVADARLGVVSGYGMVLYRYCAGAGAAVLQRTNG